MDALKFMSICVILFIAGILMLTVGISLRLNDELKTTGLKNMIGEYWDGTNK